MELALELDCKVGEFPSTYLDLPLGAPLRPSSVWNGVVERFCRRLSMLKRQYNSEGGRLTLIQRT